MVYIFSYLWLQHHHGANFCHQTAYGAQYIIQDEEFHYGSVMLELGVALHGLGDRDLEEEKIGEVSPKLMCVLV